MKGVSGGEVIEAVFLGEGLRRIRAGFFAGDVAAGGEHEEEKSNRVDGPEYGEALEQAVGEEAEHGGNLRVGGGWFVNRTAANAKEPWHVLPCGLGTGAKRDQMGRL